MITSNPSGAVLFATSERNCLSDWLPFKHLNTLSRYKVLRQLNIDPNDDAKLEIVAPQLKCPPYASQSPKA